MKYLKKYTTFNENANTARPFIIEVGLVDKFIILTRSGSYNYNYSVKTSDGQEFSDISDDLEIKFPKVGKYDIEISGDFPTIYFYHFDAVSLFMNIKQWGDIEWVTFENSFRDCTNLRMNAKDVPDLSRVKDMSGMFRNAKSFNQPLNDWDVSNVTNMSYMFYDAESFNQPLNNLDVSNVTNMSYMFYDAESFDQPLNNWDVSNVTDVSCMFNNATSFNQPLNNWCVSSVESMCDMFNGAESFNQPLNNWDVSSVVYMYSMFYGANEFYQVLDDWDVSSVTNMSSMFDEEGMFNKPVNWK